jgi:hypothetical protein
MLSDASQLGDHLRSLIATRGSTASSLSELCRSVHGAYPTTVLQIAKTLNEQHQAIDRRVLLHIGAPPRGMQVGSSLLPVPHPLDFEWRYSRRGCADLAAAIKADLRSDRGKVALLGAPGLAEDLATNGPQLDITLFELRVEACEALRSLEHDRLRVIAGDLTETWVDFNAEFTVVVADPPWYPDVTEAFLQVASRLLTDAGALLLSCPGVTTRPNIPEERSRLLEVAAASGLVFESLLPQALEYESPPFEMSALRAAGLAGFDPLWRLGDLLRFRRTPSRRRADVVTRRSRIGKDSWREVSFGRTRIRVNTKPVNDTESILQPIVAGDVLDSVSTRDPRRIPANVWTTTNRVFRSGQSGSSYLGWV